MRNNGNSDSYEVIRVKRDQPRGCRNCHNRAKGGDAVILFNPHYQPNRYYYCAKCGSNFLQTKVDEIKVVQDGNAKVLALLEEGAVFERIDGAGVGIHRERLECGICHKPVTAKDNTLIHNGYGNEAVCEDCAKIIINKSNAEKGEKKEQIEKEKGLLELGLLPQKNLKELL